ncbi:hypothetical protein ASPBRDRAFT_608579 [Aspergillus brasiliensis CBS 101740]|uniref:Uncharacterized protein n=1 Tax=Aspergillus brasiliensis (strain CBS 101740 / IMI 381727 / IBT 21946) TaxID=767769 RepID=A0A1L9UHY8_ASPBC|nr:hypothetical protein ASPBRDRAFT_608579 [Aspergillus brasiliensis CBS 101740]
MTAHYGNIHTSKVTSSIASFSHILLTAIAIHSPQWFSVPFPLKRALCRSAANLAPPVAASSAAPLGRWHEQICLQPPLYYYLAVCVLAAPARSGLSLLLSSLPPPPRARSFYTDRTIVRKESTYR